VVVLDGRAITSKSELLTTLAKSLHFPTWFGHNWDALVDCLSDANNRAVASGARGLCIIWNSASVLAALDAESVRTFADICSEMVGETSAPLLLVRSPQPITGIPTP
jgi:Barstar (barnase inhibitor)